MIKLNNIVRSIQFVDVTKYILNDMSLTVDEGEFLVIMGKSGSGKTTLLNIIGGLDSFQDGTYCFLDKKIENENQRTELRKNQFGFIIQNFALVPSLTVYDNIALGARKASKSEILKIVSDLGIERFTDQKVKNLSGGEKQRVAIARALAKKSRVILADEPTGALDSETSEQFMNLLKKLNETQGITIIMVTHNEQLKEYASRIIYMSDGKIMNNNK